MGLCLKLLLLQALGMKVGQEKFPKILGNQRQSKERREKRMGITPQPQVGNGVG